MERVICDTYVKGKKRTWDLDADDPRNQEFNRKVLAVNEMYAWLYNQGILRKVSFEFKDYSDSTYFAFDAKDLAPYRAEMEQSGVKGASLAVEHIFDAEYTPCLYSGAIELSWTMFSYRDFDGTVGRSWECELCRHLSAAGVLDVEQIKSEKGVKAAVKYAFELSGFEPSDLIEVRSLSEQDIEQVSVLDALSGNDIADALDSNDYAWGLFLGQELVGYCSLGGADDPEAGYDALEGWTNSSLLLSDVFIKEEHRGNGFAACLVEEALIKGNPENESVFLTLLDDRLSYLYEKLGFRMLTDGNMVRDAQRSGNSLDDRIQNVEAAVSGQRSSFFQRLFSSGRETQRVKGKEQERDSRHDDR